MSLTPHTPANNATIDSAVVYCQLHSTPTYLLPLLSHLPPPLTLQLFLAPRPHLLSRPKLRRSKAPHDFEIPLTPHQILNPNPSIPNPPWGIRPSEVLIPLLRYLAILKEHIFKMGQMP